MVTAKQLYKKGIEASDGHIGSVHDLYFDYQAWTLRYLVVDTGKWFPGRKVLLRPEVIVLPWHAEASVVPVRLTKDQVRSSPDINTSEPGSRETERLLHRHYGWNPYWKVRGVAALPPPQASQKEDRKDAIREAELTVSPHLCSTKEMRDYRVHSTDGEVGHIEDILFDDECRRVLFLAVDVEEWVLTKEVLIPPRVVLRIDGVNSGVDVAVLRRVIKTGQEYKPEG